MEALDLACHYILESTGDCPRAYNNFYMSCKSDCDAGCEATCWKKHFLNESVNKISKKHFLKE